VLCFIAVSTPVPSPIAVVLPDSLLPPAAAGARLHAQPLWRDWPGVAACLARANDGGFQTAGGTALEAWFAANLGVRMADNPESVGAPWAMLDAPAATPANARHYISFVHLQIATDGVYLLPPEQLQLDAATAATLWDAVSPILTAAGWRAAEPAAGGATRAFDRSAGLPIDSPSPWSAAALSLHDYLPHGPALRAWRGQWMEIQMLLHAHPLNLARQAQGLPPVNACWWWGGGAVWPARFPRVTWDEPQNDASLIVTERLRALAMGLRSTDGGASPGGDGLRIIVAGTTGPADWFAAGGVLTQFDQAIVRPLLAAGMRFDLVLLGQTGWRRFSVGAAVRWRWWRRAPPIAALTEEVAP
jgi:hypothetical protein